MTNFYRKKPVVIEARVFDGTRASVEWCGGVVTYHEAERIGGTLYKPSVSIRTLEGEMTGSIGDYIIRGVKGEFYACKPDIFLMTYEAVR